MEFWIKQLRILNFMINSMLKYYTSVIKFFIPLTGVKWIRCNFKCFTSLYVTSLFIKKITIVCFILVYSSSFLNMLQHVLMFLVQCRSYLRWLENILWNMWHMIYFFYRYFYFSLHFSLFKDVIFWKKVNSLFQITDSRK